MTRRFTALLSLMLTAGLLAQAQEPARAVPAAPSEASSPAQTAPWIVSVVHTMDLRKMMEHMRGQQDVRVGVPGYAPTSLLNVTTGLVIDDQGHILTRLPNLGPQDKEYVIAINRPDGSRLPARLIGIDCPTGFAVLEVPALKVSPPEFVPAASLSNDMAVKILSADAESKEMPGGTGGQFYLSSSIKSTSGLIRTDSVYARARRALSLRSYRLYSRNDSCIVTLSDNRVVGMGEYAGYGRAYLYPAEMLRDVVAKRVIEKKGSVAQGWLGTTGVNVAQISDAEFQLLGLTRREGVIVREVANNGPAARFGVKPNDVIVGMDEVEVIGTSDMGAMLLATPAGRQVRLKAVRKGQPLEVGVVLGARDYTGPTIPLYISEPRGGPPMSEFERLQNRLGDLVAERKMLIGSIPRNAGPAPKDTLEALRELDLEIRQLLDGIRSLENQGLAKPSPAPDTPNVDTPATVCSSLGLSGSDLTLQLANVFGVKGGIFVKTVLKDSPADQAGIKAGDVIESAAGLGLATCSKLRISFSGAGKSIPVTIVRKPMETGAEIVRIVLTVKTAG